MPVSWQIAPSPFEARSMFSAMMFSACAERVPAGSARTAVFMAARTSGGNSVEVRMMSWSTLSKNEGGIREVYWLGIWDLGLARTDDWTAESLIPNPCSYVFPH